MSIFAIPTLSNDSKMQSESHAGYQHHPEMLLTTLETCPFEFMTCVLFFRPKRTIQTGIRAKFKKQHL